MATALQMEANQNNARLSTGPKTESGKAVSARNALRHGLASGLLITGWESREEYDALLAGLVQEHQPATATETILVHQMAQHHWLAQRAIFLQQVALEAARDPSDVGKKLDLLVRYQTANERAFHKALSTLLKLKNEKKKTEIGFVSQESAPAEIAETGGLSEPLREPAAELSVPGRPPILPPEAG